MPRPASLSGLGTTSGQIGSGELEEPALSVSVISSFASGIGLLVGFLLGVVATLYFVSQGALTLQPPVLSPRPPAGVEVLINDVPLEGDVVFTADVPQRVVVRAEGFLPLEVDLTLQAGEYRVLTISEGMLTPEEPLEEPSEVTDEPEPTP